MRRTPEQYSIIEHALVLHQIRRDKARFLARLERNTRQEQAYAKNGDKIEGVCVVWTGAKSRDGYGGMNVKILRRLAGKEYGIIGWREPGMSLPNFKLLVHRLAIILKTGKPIPPGSESGHYACFNRACIRHVKIETHAENCSVRDQRALLRRLGYDV